MTSTSDKQFQMRASQEFLDRIDDWRRAQADIPPRSEAIRRLVELALSQPAVRIEANPASIPIEELDASNDE